MRIVLDTNVLVRANIKVQGPARDLLQKIAYGDHVIITSPFLLREVERVLAYPRLQKLWGLTMQDIEEHVQFLALISDLVHPVVEAPIVLIDPNDDPVVYTAAHGKADVLCTLDRDFFMSRRLWHSVPAGGTNHERCGFAAKVEADLSKVSALRVGRSLPYSAPRELALSRAERDSVREAQMARVTVCTNAG